MMRLLFVLPVFLAACLASHAESTNTPPSSGSTGNAQVVPDNLKPGKPADLNVAEFEKLWKTERYVVLDVRTPKEFAAGHLPGAVNLDFLADDFKRKVATLDTNKVYLVYCASGRRSANACAEMKRLQFPHLANMLGGYKAWESANKPTERPAR